MPVTPTYPGVYIEELPSGVRTLMGVGTSIAAFVGRAPKGPINNPTTIFSYGDYERSFGGLHVDSMMSYAVRQFYLNGGGEAVIVRVADVLTTPTATKASKTVAADTGGSGNLVVTALNEGAWGNKIFAEVIQDAGTADTVFTLRIRERAGTTTADTLLREEVFYNVSITPANARFVTTIVENESQLVRITSVPTTKRPVVAAEGGLTGGADGDVPGNADYIGSETNKTGMWALEKTDLFNLLCIPPITRGSDLDITIWDEALKMCKKRRAILLVDPKVTWSASNTTLDDASGILHATAGLDGSAAGNFKSLRDKHAAIYFPLVKFSDPLRDNQVHDFVPCGAVAGVIARTDSERGIWKAPAGIDARLSGVQGLSVSLTDGQNGRLNPLGINVLRSMPAAGNVVWGARTLDGADRLASEWKYLPVRRVALYIEESLYRGTQWVVFEPNDESLWAQIRLNVGAFMHQMFRQGAFQGAKPSESYFVKCDSETTTQNDINQGVVNIVVGFAPLKPAEFVIIKLQQMAGQIVS